MSEWKHDETFVIVYQNTENGEYILIPTIKNDESYVLTILNQKGGKQQLRNLFKVNYKGEVTKFQDLQLGPELKKKIKELTGK